jgi:hypothetical protein
MNDDDRQYARGPGRHHRSRGPVVAAYADTGAIDRSCPNCGANPQEYCIHDNGVQRKMPCPNRLPHNPDTGGSE